MSRTYTPSPMYKYSAMQKAGGSGGLGIASNMISNGGFEDGTTDWLFVESGTIFEIETTTVYADSQSAKLTIGGTGNNISQSITTVTGQDYRGSGWVYLEAGTVSAYLYAAVLPATGVISTPASTSTTGSWVNLTFTFTAGTPTTYIGCGLTTAGGAIAYFDEIEVYKV